MTKNKTMTFYIEEITPDLAKEFLKKNSRNRPIRPTVVADYVEQLKAGTFKTTHQPIAFDPDGNLLDGQHRLTAIVESGISCVLAVAENCDPATFDVIDGGSGRAGFDLFVIKYKEKYGQAPANWNMVTAIASNAVRGMGSNDATKHESSDFALKRYKVISKVIAALGKTDQRKILGACVMAAFVNAISYYGEDKVWPHLERLASAMWASTKDPMKILWERLTKIKLTEGVYAKRQVKLTQRERYSLAVGAIRATLQGHQVTAVQVVKHDFGGAPVDVEIRRGTAPRLSALHKGKLVQAESNRVAETAES